MSARTKKIKPWIFWLSGIGVILSLALAGIFFIHPSYPSRIGVAIVGDPTIVISYDSRQPGFIAIQIPSDVAVDAAYGYGTYPLASVWELDSMDKRRGKLYMKTLEDAIGIPIQYYIKPSKETFSSHNSIEDYSMAVFSYISVFAAMVGSVQTNIPPWLLFEISRSLVDIHPTDTILFDLEHQEVLYDVLLPDGTHRTQIDPGKLDILIGTHAEDPEIRKEHLRIGVYNTTKLPGLAQKVARVMEQAGFHVVIVANDTSLTPDRCIIESSKDLFSSVSLQTLVWLYGCTLQEQTHSSQHDVTLFVGKDIEQWFLPFP